MRSCTNTALILSLAVHASYRSMSLSTQYNTVCVYKVVNVCVCVCMCVCVCVPYSSKSVVLLMMSDWK